MATSQRIAYIETIKGLLILCLLYGHYKVMAWDEGMSDIVLRVMNGTVGLYNCFFMQTFFIITGFCSSYNVSFFRFLLKNIKTLITPAILLEFISFLVLSGLDDDYLPCLWQNIMSFSGWLTTGGPWFIISLFWVKILFWFIAKFSNLTQLFICVLLYVCGLALNDVDIIPNYMWHRHSLLMVIYMYMGYYAKSHKDIIRPWLRMMSIVAVPLIIALNI